MSTARAVVIGASFAGLLAGAAAARAGLTVTILERDVLPGDASPRPGVPQGRQPHILLRRGLDAIEALLPGLSEELVELGGVRFNTGQIPWLSEFGWVPLSDIGYDIVSLSRPLLESAVRDRVAALDRVEIVEGVRVSGLTRTASRWSVEVHDATSISAEVVIDASGRSSRLPHWLADLGVATEEPTVVEAGLGYASRRYAGTVSLSTGIVVLSSPNDPRGGLALRIEGDSWLVCAAGYGEHRPGRSNEDFAAFLASLRDPALSDLAEQLVPVSDVAVHRQTANQRHTYGTGADWPPGLLVVGDALCAFNPIYGQGITVAALEAELLVAELGAGRQDTRRMQRRFLRLTDLPWAVATGSDLRILGVAMSPRQRLADWWTVRLSRLAAGDDESCAHAFADVYHLVGSPLLLLSPAVVVAVVRSLVRGIPPPAHRPAVLDALSGPESYAS